MNRLDNAQTVNFPGNSIEDVAVDSQGNIYVPVGAKSSSIYRVRPDNLTRLELLAENEYQIMGVYLSPDEKKLALADQTEGLKILDIESGKITKLVGEFNGRKFVSTNSITFSDDSTIFFTHTG